MSCDNSESAFDEELRHGYVLLIQAMYGNAFVYDEIKGTWHKAIYDNESPSGKYCDDFNVEIGEIVDSLDAYDLRNETKRYSDSLLMVASHLNSPPSSRKDCYDDFVSIVSDVSKLTRSALYPSGSLQEYRDKNGELFDTIAAKLDKFKIKYGTLLPQTEDNKIE